eukprot:TRINITY_DN23079_c0_g1_i2.p1 TRINITY_DN23079_c0_g1~~TRINITY_DN23079_c0_g1_i2.p1  ORF type:complete len:414 (+),score=136.75 TRINITY_DN23079_c0_g1_i2:92-1243(+)
MSLLGATDDDGAAAAFDPLQPDLSPEDLQKFAESRDLYGLLGVGPKCSTDDIEQSYRSRSRALHPDKHSGSAHRELYQAAFQAVVGARATLADPALRRAYDLSKGVRGKKAGKWSFEALRAARKAVDEDRRRVSYEVHLESQLQRANMYQDLHEQGQVLMLGAVIYAVRRSVLDKMKAEGWDRDRAAAYGCEVIGREGAVTADDIDEWAEAGDEEATMSVAELEAKCDLIDGSTGRLRNFKDFASFGALYGRGNGWAESAPEVDSKCSDRLRMRLEEQRKRRREEADEAEAEKRRRTEDAARAQREAEAAEKEAELAAFRGSCAAPAATAGFTAAPAKQQRPSAAVHTGVAGILAAIRPGNEQTDPDPQPEGLGLGLGGYDSD